MAEYRIHSLFLDSHQLTYYHIINEMRGSPRSSLERLTGENYRTSSNNGP